MPIIAWEIKIWRALRQSKTPTFYERDHRLRMMAMSKIDVLWGLVPDRTDMTQQTTNLLSECINGAFLTNFFNLQACPEASAVLKFLVAKTATAAKTVTAAKWFKTTLSFAFLPKSPTGTTQGQPGASAPGPSANISKSPTGTTHGESEHAIADRGVVPVGDLLRKSPRIPGAEAPGWPCVVPVGDFLEKSPRIPGAEALLITHKVGRRRPAGTECGGLRSPAAAREHVKPQPYA